MTVQQLSLSTLKSAKNSVIGNPTAKLALAHDEAFIRTLVDCIHNPPPPLEESTEALDKIRIEAAHVIASLSYGSSDTLRMLLRYNAHEAFLYAISCFRPSENPKLKAAFARSLRAIAVAIAQAVGPPQWGLGTTSPDARMGAKDALDYLFQTEVLDIYLPLLVDPSQQVSMSIAQLLASAVRTEEHRVDVSEWLPSAERLKEVKGKRGWEKPNSSSLPSRQGGWVIRNLTALLQRKDSKLQEAALNAVACLAKNNPLVAASLLVPAADHEEALYLVLSLCKSRSAELRLAACLCATHIIRAGPSQLPLSTSDDSPAMTVMYVINRFIASESDSAQTRTKACFILSNLVTDNKELCHLAFQRKSLEKLASLINVITPSEKSVESQEDEPESLCSLREAALTAVASISLFDDDIRNEVAGELKLIPAIQTSLSHHHVGVRYAACQCVRALSRSVAVLRTNIVDSGLAMAAYQLFLKQDEDRRVTFVASSVICNLVMEASPLRTVVLEQGLLPRLTQLLHSGENVFRLNALWAMKNLLYHCPPSIKKQIIDALGWHELSLLLMDPDPEIQEQALLVLRHLADQVDDVAMVFDRLGSDELLDIVASAMESDSEDVMHAAVCVLANFANSASHQERMLSHSRILPALKQCLVDGTVRIRQPAVSCIRELVKNYRTHKPLLDAGIVRTLRHICEYTGNVSRSMTRSGLMMCLEDQVVLEAREALHMLEDHVEMDM